MTGTELQTAKEELLILMEELHGRNYTFGWMRAAYVDPRPDIDDKVALKVLKELREEKAKKEEKA